MNSRKFAGVVSDDGSAPRAPVRVPAAPPEKAQTLGDIRALLQAEVLCGGDLAVRVDSVGAADLMSDVLALSRPGMLLLTGLTTPQVINTAVVSDLTGVVFVRGKKPPPEALALARDKGVTVLSTRLTMFEASGLLYWALFGS